MDLIASSDSGASNTDNITNVTKPTITGTADANATITLYDGGGTTILGTTTANSSGIWSITPTANLTNGNHNLTATATDIAGNSNTSTPLTVTIDTIAPTVAISSNVATLKAGETATITFTFSENPGTTFTRSDITVSGGSLSAISGTGVTRTATFTPTPDTQTTANAAISVKANSYTDLAGNQGSGNTLTQALDTRQLTIVRAVYTGYSIKVEYNGTVDVTGVPKLEVRNSTGTLLGSYSYVDIDTSRNHYVYGQTLVFNGGEDLTNKMLSINLNGGTIKSKDDTKNYLGETIAKGTNAQLSPPTYWGRDGYGLPSVTGMRKTIYGTDSHDLFEFNKGNQYDVITGAAKGGDTFQIRQGAALIGNSVDSLGNPQFSTITNFRVGIDNLVGNEFSVNSYQKKLSTDWKTMRILDGASTDQSLTALSLGSITTLLGKTSVDSYSSLRPILANFEGKGATAFTFGSGNSLRTFVAIDNDGINGFDSTKDSIVEFTQLSGDLRDLAIWKVL